MRPSKAAEAKPAREPRIRNKIGSQLIWSMAGILHKFHFALVFITTRHHPPNPRGLFPKILIEVCSPCDTCVELEVTEQASKDTSRGDLEIEHDSGSLKFTQSFSTRLQPSPVESPFSLHPINTLLYKNSFMSALLNSPEDGMFRGLKPTATPEITV